MRLFAGRRNPYARAVADMAIGLGIFALLVSLVGGEGRPGPMPHFADLLSISANAAEITNAPDPSRAAAEAASIVKAAVPMPQPVASSPLQFASPQTAMMLLAAMFSILVAFNLAFFRHLRHQHVRVRRRRW